MFQCDKMGPGRKFHDTVVVKGTFVLAPGRLEIADDQDPVAPSDQYWDPENAERSSLRRAGEAVLAKAGTDVVVTGTARPPGCRPALRWQACLVVRGERGTVLSHTLTVTGPRRWRHQALRGWGLTDPEPASGVPVRYELAYGGVYLEDPQVLDPARQRWRIHEPNPSGTGFFALERMDRRELYPGPQWEHPLHPVSHVNRDVPLAGFGPVARPWSSRRRYAGTYDAAWEEKARSDVRRGLPADYPADFDLRFFNCAHPALVAPGHLQGDEQIGLAGLTGSREPFTTRLPGISLSAALLDGSGRRQDRSMPLDTVQIDLDASRVHLCWRLSLDQAEDVRAAVIFPEGGAVSEALP